MCLYTCTRPNLYAKSNNDLSQAHMRLDRGLARIKVCASSCIKPDMCSRRSLRTSREALLAYTYTCL